MLRATPQRPGIGSWAAQGVPAWVPDHSEGQIPIADPGPLANLPPLACGKPTGTHERCSVWPLLLVVILRSGTLGAQPVSTSNARVSQEYDCSCPE